MLAAYVLGVAAAVPVSNARCLPIPYLGTTALTRVAAFLIIFIAVTIIAKIIERILKNILENLNLGGLDRILGLVFGLVEGILVVSVVVFLVRVQPFFDLQDFLASSKIASLLSGIIPANTDALFERIKKTGV